jgi:hypothetical protein
VSLHADPSLSDIRPLEIERDEMGNPIRIGCHSGPGEALNVRNPKMGFSYYFCRNKHSEILRFLNRGWEMVQKGDQEDWGAALPAHIQSAIDTTKPFQDVILMRAPNEIVGKEQAERVEEARLAREGIDRQYDEKGEAIRASLGTQKTIYHTRSDHGYYYEER